MTKNHASYIDKLSLLTSHSCYAKPVKANVLVCDKGKVIERHFAKNSSWQSFLDSLYLPDLKSKASVFGRVLLEDGEQFVLEDGEWSWLGSDSANQASQNTDPWAEIIDKVSDSRPETKQRITLTKATDKALPLPYLELVSEGQENLEAWAAKSLTDSGQFGCMGPDPVAEANLLTLMRLIVAASGNQSKPPVSMADYWNATTLPAVRAAAQALLDFKAAVEF